jgi:hypothetical protein
VVVVVEEEAFHFVLAGAAEAWRVVVAGPHVAELVVGH